MKKVPLRLHLFDSKIIKSKKLEKIPINKTDTEADLTTDVTIVTIFHYYQLRNPKKRLMLW